MTKHRFISKDIVAKEIAVPSDGHFLYHVIIIGSMIIGQKLTVTERRWLPVNAIITYIYL